MASIDLEPEELRKILLSVASEAAAHLRDLACSSEELSKNLGGETALIDIISEDYIIGALREELGNIRIVTEEKGVVGEGTLTLVIDPLDGSSNYLNCIPWSSVSIAAIPTGGTTADAIAGVVAPIFWGVPLSFARGEGCFQGNTRVYCIDPPSRFVFVYIDHPDAAEPVARVIKGLGGGYKVRSLGSAALEIAYVGLGRASLFIDMRSKLRNVDIAAAQGIVRECGGMIVDPSGSPIEVAVDRVRRAGNMVAAPSREIASRVIHVLHGET